MPFNKEINGYENEYEFVDYLDGRLFKNVNFIFQDLLTELYGNIDDNEMIRCWINYKKQKNDISIKINETIKIISIKKGVKNSVHVEHIRTFIDFLANDCHISNENINKLLMYHYADGTTNGNGKFRQSVADYKEKNQNSIDEFNYLIDYDILKKMIVRFVLLGNNSEIEIDAIIYGVIDDFIWITNEEIVEIIMRKKDDYSTSIHFGGLTYQPMNRCLNYNKKYEYLRHYIQIKWYNISDDIIEMMNERVVKG